MTDRYEKIRAALAMGPTPGPRKAVEQSVIGPQDLSILFAKVTFSVGVNGRHSVPIEEAIANAALAAACDPDTVQALIAERDALAAEVEQLRRERDEVGECCCGANPLCAAGCLVEASLRRRLADKVRGEAG